MAPDSMETDQHEEEISSTRAQQVEQHRQSFFVSGKLTHFDGSSGGMVLCACISSIALVVYSLCWYRMKRN